jgi:alpha-tubulin suppressor-like RCC1 family protein
VVVGRQALSNVVSIAAANSFGLALKRDGRLVAWGKNEVPAGLSNVVAIAARGFYSVALKRDGTVASWASMPPLQSQAPATLSNVVAVACGGEGYERSMALRRDGTVVVWKAGIPSEEAVPPEVRDVVAIAAGGSHSLALRRDGTVFGWGFNADGQATGVPTETLPDAVGFTSGLVTIGGRILSNVVAIAAAGPYSLALKRSGEVVAWGDKRHCRGVPVGLTNVVAIAAGRGYCLAVTTNPAPFGLKK